MVAWLFKTLVNTYWDKIMGVVNAVKYPVQFPITMKLGKRPDA